MRQTTIVKHKEVDKKWWLIDAEGVIVGSLAVKVANILRGKNKPTFTPNVDMGDNVVIINAEKVVLSSDKEDKKIYYSHSGYPGGLKTISAKDLRAKRPTEIIRKAIKGMIPHTSLGRKQISNVFIYAGSEHKHEAQQPVKIEVK